MPSAGNRLSLGQSGDLNHGRDGSMEHILNSPLDRKDISYYDKMLLSKKLYLKNLETVALLGYIGFLLLFRAGTKILGIVSLFLP